MVDVTKATAGRVGRSRLERVLSALKVAAVVGLCVGFLGGALLEVLHNLNTHVMRGRYHLPGLGVVLVAVCVAACLALLVGLPLALRRPAMAKVYSMGGGGVRRWDGGGGPDA